MKKLLVLPLLFGLCATVFAGEVYKAPNFKFKTAPVVLESENDVHSWKTISEYQVSNTPAAVREIASDRPAEYVEEPSRGPSSVTPNPSHGVPLKFMAQPQVLY